MAITAARRYGNQEIKGFARRQSLYGFSFTSSGTGTPVSLIEDEADDDAGTGETGGLVASIARASAGVYTVTLNCGFQRIRAFASVQLTDCDANAWASTEADASADVITVETRNASQALADLDARIDVLLQLVHASG